MFWFFLVEIQLHLDWYKVFPKQIDRSIPTANANPESSIFPPPINYDWQQNRVVLLPESLCTDAWYRCTTRKPNIADSSSGCHYFATRHQFHAQNRPRFEHK